MKYIHYLKADCFFKKQEIQEDLEVFKKEFSHTLQVLFGPNKGICTHEIIIAEEPFLEDMIEITYTIQTQTLPTFKHLINNFTPEEQEEIYESLDDDLCIYTRIDKPTFLEKKTITKVFHGNCIRIKTKIAAYPAKIENAQKTIKAIREKL
ncbi:MAG: hypothetical protein ACMXYK_03090 [Candidatus Woesearchaeota archaeon]